jgi:hypothetical protein
MRVYNIFAIIKNMMNEKSKEPKYKDVWEFINNMPEKPQNEQQQKFSELINKLCPNGKKYGPVKTQEN